MSGTTQRVVERRTPAADPEALPVDLHPVLRRVYAHRGIRSTDELEQGLDALHPPNLLHGMDAAVEILVEAVCEQRRVLFIGDFDADGATSCAVAIRALTAMGATSVDYLVPNRFEFGYGLSPEIVEVASERAPDLVVTVDNGISSHAGVAAAKRHGMRVIVTDHHLPGDTLPPADALVNPNLPGDDFPSKSLAGVGVIFYVMAALRGALRARGWFEATGRRPPNLGDVLDLVALGTVADVVPLDRNNRILVEQGLRRIRAGRACPGVQALLDVSGRNAHRTVAADLGFAIGPRLNAAGRLEDMSVGIECLLADDAGRARELAGLLDELNRQRREIEGQMRAEAIDSVERLVDRLDADAVPLGLCLMEPDWHQGVIGIVASRVKERFHRPVIAFAPAGEGALKGSARSVPGLHMRDLLERIDTTHPGIIDRFGGHAMAAGLSLPTERFEAFREAFERVLAAEVSHEDLASTLVTDGELAPGEMTMDTARALRAGGPWGQGFPEPLFDGTFRVIAKRVVGGSHLKLKVQPVGEGDTLEAIAFGGLERGWETLDADVRLAYRLDVNEFRGRESLQLIVVHMEAADGADRTQGEDA